MSTPARLSAIPLHFQGSYHLARRREDLAQSLIAPSSDSLKGALAAAWVRLQGPGLPLGAALDFLRSFQISSAFPCHTDADGQRHYQLPVPIGAWPPPNLRQDKQARKQQFLDQKDFESWYLGVGDLGNVILNAAKRSEESGVGLDVESTQDSLSLSNSLSNSLSHSLQTRIQSARPWAGEKDARPFLTERRSFADSQGLYFLLACDNPARRAEVLSALDLLGDQGLGSAKSVGGGHFRAGPPEDWHCPAPAPGLPLAYMALGRFLPAPAYQALLPTQVLSYRLCSGGGFSAGAAGGLHRQLRRSAWLLGEGSLFAEDPSAHGTQLDLAPDHAPHPIYRDGACLFLPIHRPAFLPLNPHPHA
jgi:CRISPR type III-A-associated RAMP protein Csm4